MGNIVLLDDLTINKIAAGEVIERPASVVKELVENSIDAGANNISVEIKNGGISYIRVTDNGKGIMPDDMEIAFERHATSKIRAAEDLDTIKSMGFRGEALASIAAIAKVDMKSKTELDMTGYQIIVEGGNILTKQEAGCPNGTSITIENLFYNTPVRYKFLKKDFTESGYIEDVITRIALIHPEIAIKLISSGKTIIQTSGNKDIKSVIYNIYGKEIAENVLNVDYLYEDVRISGVIGKPTIARSNRSNQLFFVNQRYVKDKTLSSSAEQAFKGMVTIGKYGFLILNIEMNPQKVDVNVHPAKLEVRFQEEQNIFKAVFHAIKDTLLKNDLVSNGENEKEKTQDNLKKEETQKEETINLGGGLFQRILHKPEKEETYNLVEDLYNTRKLNIPKEEDVTSNFNSIMEKMAEMKDSINQFKDNRKITNIKTDVEIEKKIEFEPLIPKEKQEIEEQPKITLENEENVLPTTIAPNSIIEMVEENTLPIKVEEQIQENKEKTEEQEILDKSQIEEQPTIVEKQQEEVEEPFEEMYSSVFGKSPVVEKEQEEIVEVKEEEETYKAPIQTAENVSLFSEEQDRAPRYKFIGIAFSTYIIIELNKELYIIDQHAAHERIMYEKIKANYYYEGEKDSQLMLLPDVIRLTHKEMDIAKDNMDMFKKAGFMVEEFGENTIKLSGVPNICLELDTRELFLETLDEINTVARTAKQEIEEKFIATIACKAAVKANMALDKEEVDRLMEDLLRLPNPFTCPHGRPTAIRMTKTDIEKKFSRR